MHYNLHLMWWNDYPVDNRKTNNITDSLYAGCLTRISLFIYQPTSAHGFLFCATYQNRTLCIWGLCVEPDSTFWHRNLVQKQDANMQTYLSVSIITTTSSLSNWKCNSLEIYGNWIAGQKQSIYSITSSPEINYNNFAFFKNKLKQCWFSSTKFQISVILEE